MTCNNERVDEMIRAVRTTTACVITGIIELLCSVVCIHWRRSFCRLPRRPWGYVKKWGLISPLNVKTYLRRTTLPYGEGVLPPVGATATARTSHRWGWLVTDRGIAWRSRHGDAGRRGESCRPRRVGWRHDSYAWKCGQSELMHIGAHRVRCVGGDVGIDVNKCTCMLYSLYLALLTSVTSDRQGPRSVSEGPPVITSFRSVTPDLGGFRAIRTGGLVDGQGHFQRVIQGEPSQLRLALRWAQCTLTLGLLKPLEVLSSVPRLIHLELKCFPNWFLRFPTTKLHLPRRCRLVSYSSPRRGHKRSSFVLSTVTC